MDQYSKLHVSCKGSYILEYDRVCRYQPSSASATDLAASECTPLRRKISNSRFFLQSSSYDVSDPRDYKKRYQNFNDIYTSIGTVTLT